MPTTRPLRTALLANATFSTLCALLLLTQTAAVGELLGLAAPLMLQLLGGGLLLFAAELVQQATRSRLATWRALYASAGDLLWVLGSGLGLLLFPNQLSTTGTALVLIVAGFVLAFGLWQLWGILHAHRSPTSSLYRHCLVVQTEASASAIWAIVERMGEIQRYMPSLAKSELLADREPGVGAVRRCTDRSGRCWAEECLHFEPGRSLTLRFLTAAPDFPFPASQMLGGWQVTPAGDGAEVAVWFELAPQPRWLAPVLLPLLALRADRDFVRVIQRMTDEALGRDRQSPSRWRSASAWLLPRFC